MCASHGYPVLVHRQRGNKVFFHQALQDRKLLAIPGIHYFDAHRLRAHLLQASELQLHPRTATSQSVTGAEGAGDAVEDYSSDEERDTTDAETDAEAEAEESWCPPIPDMPDNPTGKRDRWSRRQVSNYDAGVSIVGRVVFFLDFLADPMVLLCCNALQVLRLDSACFGEELTGMASMSSDITMRC